MSITIVHGTPHLLWAEMVPASTIYVGGIVTVNTTAPEEGVEQLPVASGVANVTNQDIPLGVCIGTNRLNPLFSTTYKTEYVTSPAASDAHDGASIDYTGSSPMKAYGDPIPMVKIALIDATTILRAPIYNAEVGKAPTVVTVTTGNASGVAGTTTNVDFTAEASNMQTIYFRTGANSGAYRMTAAASLTAHTWDLALRNDVSIGDKAVMVPCRTIGYSTIQFGSTDAAYVDCSQAPSLGGTDRWSVVVTKLSLAVAGREYVEFRFDPSHFGHNVTTN